jgi:hypothetical protein
MSDKPPPEDLIELPLSHKESWDSVDKGGASPKPDAEALPGERPPPPRPSPRTRRAAGARRAVGGRRRSGAWSSRSGAWVVWLALAAVAAVAYWLFWPSAPRVSFDPSPLVFAEQRTGVSSEPLSVTLTNAGERVLRIDSVGVAGSPGADFATAAEDCSRVELNQGSQCRVSVVFTPTQVGARSGELVVAGNVSGKRAVLPLAGEAVAPRLGSRPESLDFGSEAVGATSAGRELELVNEGSAPLAIERVSVESPDGEFRLIGNQCSAATLSPGESCGLRVVFRPALFGRRSARMVVVSDSSGGEQAIRLEGAGSGPDLEIRPEGLRFETQVVGTRSSAAVLTLFNKGDEPYRIDRAWIDGGGFSIVRENCSGASIAPRGSCRVEVVFAPTEEGEARTSLQIRESSGAMAPGIAISGTAVAPRLELSATALGFGARPVGERTDALPLRLTNAGSAPLAISELDLTGPDTSAFVLGQDSCSGRRLAPRQRCEIAFDFRPRHAGAHQARLAVATDQRGISARVELTGHGEAPVIEPDRSRLDFAAVRQTESQDLRVEISNGGDAPLRLGAVRIAGAAARDFDLAGNACTQATLPPGGSCRLVVRFAPQGTGPRDARLVVESNARTEPLELVMRGSGLAPPAAGIRVTPTVVDLGSWPVGERSEVATIRVASTGAGRLEIGEMRLSGPGAADFHVVAGTCQGLPYLAPGGECTFGVRFTAGAPGAREATLVIEHNAPGAPMRMSLRAEGF